MFGKPTEGEGHSLVLKHPSHCYLPRLIMQMKGHHAGTIKNKSAGPFLLRWLLGNPS